MNTVLQDFFMGENQINGCKDITYLLISLFVEDFGGDPYGVGELNGGYGR